MRLKLDFANKYVCTVLGPPRAESTDCRAKQLCAKVLLRFLADCCEAILTLCGAVSSFAFFVLGPSLVRVVSGLLNLSHGWPFMHSSPMPAKVWDDPHERLK